MRLAQEPKDAHAGQEHQEQDSRQQIQLERPSGTVPVLVQPDRGEYLASFQHATHDNNWQYSRGENGGEPGHGIIGRHTRNGYGDQHREISKDHVFTYPRFTGTVY